MDMAAPQVLHKIVLLHILVLEIRCCDALRAGTSVSVPGTPERPGIRLFVRATILGQLLHRTIVKSPEGVARLPPALVLTLMIGRLGHLSILSVTSAVVPLCLARF